MDSVIVFEKKIEGKLISLSWITDQQIKKQGNKETAKTTLWG